MARIIDSDGNSIQVEKEQNYLSNHCVSISDNVVLKEKFIVNIFKRNTNIKKNEESEFVCEIMYNKEPTKDQLIYELIKNDVSRYDGYATIEKAYMVDFEDC